MRISVRETRRVSAQAGRDDRRARPGLRAKGGTAREQHRAVSANNRTETCSESRRFKGRAAPGQGCRSRATIPLSGRTSSTSSGCAGRALAISTNAAPASSFRRSCAGSEDGLRSCKNKRTEGQSYTENASRNAISVPLSNPVPYACRCCFPGSGYECSAAPRVCTRPGTPLAKARRHPCPPGRVRVKVDPRPGSLSTDSPPPMATASSRLMASPSPVPSAGRVRLSSTCAKGSKMR